MGTIRDHEKGIFEASQRILIFPKVRQHFPGRRKRRRSLLPEVNGRRRRVI